MSDIEELYSDDENSINSDIGDTIVPSKNKKNSNIFTLKKNNYFDFGGDSYHGGGDNESDDDKEIEEGEEIEKEDIEEGEVIEDDDVEEGEIIEDDDVEEGEIIEDNEEDDDNEDNDNNTIINKNSKELLKKQPTKKISNNLQPINDEDDYDDDDEYEENYLQKFDSQIKKNYIDDFHQECFIHNYDEISKMTNVVRDNFGIIIDPLHKTLPYLTKYERTRVLGQRAKQIENNEPPFVKVPENIIDGYIIAELELQQKKIPFIIKRPMPGGGVEYWHLRDLELISF